MNAIITAATGYTEEHLRIFLCSIEQNCQDTLVFLIAYRRDHQAIDRLQARYKFIRPVYISSFLRQQFARLANFRTRPLFTWFTRQLSRYPYSATPIWISELGKFAIRIIHERYFIALKILQTHHRAFSHVLLTDCRDVVLQSDPFCKIDNKLISGLEPAAIKDEKYTLSWLELVYGTSFINSVLDKSVICAGVTLGPTQQVHDYLTQICDEMWTHLPNMVFKDVGYDQAAHIHIIYNEQINTDLSSNHQGIVATVSMENPQKMQIDHARQSVRVHNHYPAIIHQYDRHPELLYFFNNLFTQSQTELSQV